MDQPWRACSEGVCGQYEIGHQDQTEKRGEHSEKDNDAACRLELAGFEQAQGEAVADHGDKGHENAHDHKADPNPQGKGPTLGSFVLQAQELAQRNAKLGDHKAENDNADVGAYLNHEGAFISEMVAVLAVVIEHGQIPRNRLQEAPK